LGESFALYIEGIKITVGNVNFIAKIPIQQEILLFTPKIASKCLPRRKEDNSREKAHLYLRLAVRVSTGAGKNRKILNFPFPKC